MSMQCISSNYLLPVYLITNNPYLCWSWVEKKHIG